MCFMQTESVLQTKNRSGPAKNWFSVAVTVCAKYQRASVKAPLKAVVQDDFLMHSLSKHKHNPYLIGKNG